MKKQGLTVLHIQGEFINLKISKISQQSHTTTDEQLFLKIIIKNFG